MAQGPSSASCKRALGEVRREAHSEPDEGNLRRPSARA